MITSQTLQFFHGSQENEKFQTDHCTDLQAIDRVKNIAYADFFTNYLMLNKPCIILHEATSKWKSSVEWVQNNRPNFDFLMQEFGSCQIPVANCHIQEYNAHKKECMNFKDYLNYWCSNEQAKKEKLLYLKDWHFKRQYPEYPAYETPEYFHSDWLNEFCEGQDDDYKFVYMGPKGTSTPLHADVFGSYSWSINICGSKKWLLFPPGNEQCLKNNMGQLPFMVDQPSLDKEDGLYIEVIQKAQEIIFVPSGWYHQVINLEDTISINHNWFNGCNINYIWGCLFKATKEVEDAIADCKGFDDWDDQVQMCLKAHHGMHHSDFLRMLQFISRSRMDKFDCSNEPIDWHSIFDLLSIKHLGLKMRAQVSGHILQSLQDLISNIDNFLSDLKNHATFQSNQILDDIT